MRQTLKPGLFVSLFILALSFAIVPVRGVDTLPAKLTDTEFWQLVSTFSEPDGFFHSNNFVSNERSFQHVLAELAADRQPGSAYIGVGPEQNFTYLLAVKPKIAFIVDIRRQNLIQHLMYKALFELSADRADFLSRLLSRVRPEKLGRDSTVDDLFASFESTSLDVQLSDANLRAIKDHLMENHRFPLNREDEASLERVFRAFNIGGANLTYDGPIPARGVLTGTGIMPTFEELMRETDKEGIHRSFLATEENFRTVQELHKKNLLIPVVGNFAGSHALRSVGRYLRDHDATVTAFYTSNVEQYLFMDQSWTEFYANVSMLPLDGKSMFIRGLIRSIGGQYSPSPALPSSSRYETVLFPILPLITAFDNGTVRVYDDILRAR
jgi:hypothetical protein